MAKAPILRRTYVGRKGKYCHRRCPYSTQDIADRIPSAEQTDHSDTGGRMDPLSGPRGMTWQCDSDLCSFFLGSAVTELTQDVNRVASISGGQYIYEVQSTVIPICSGTRFREY